MLTNVYWDTVRGMNPLDQAENVSRMGRVVEQRTHPTFNALEAAIHSDTDAIFCRLMATDHRARAMVADFLAASITSIQIADRTDPPPPRPSRPPPSGTMTKSG